MKPGRGPSGRIELVTPGRKRLVRIASRLLPGWTARQAEAMLLKPPRKCGRAAEVLDVWGRRASIELDGARIGSWHIGPLDAQRVLLVHGWGGYGAQLAGFIPGLLERGFSVEVFDHLGHGVSDGRAGALPEFMAGLVAVAEHAGEVAGVVAHSMGAAATLHALREGTLQAPKVVLIAAPGNFEQHLRTLSRRVGLGRGAHRSLRQRLERRYRPVNDIDRLEGLPIAGTDALLVHDEDDAEVGFEHLATLHHAWPGSRMLATSGWGHHRVLRAPELQLAAAQFIVGQEVGRERP